MPRSEELAERLVRLAGGVENCLEQAEDAADKGELKWALKMADVVLDCRHHADGDLSSDAEEKAKEIKSRCLRSLGEKEISANGRNWYFTAALENEGYVVYPDVAQVKSRVYLTKMIDAFRVLTIRLCPIKSQNAIKCAVFYFADIDEFLQMQGGCVQCCREISLLGFLKSKRMLLHNSPEFSYSNHGWWDSNGETQG